MTADELFRAFSQVLKLSVGAPLVLSACTRLDTSSLEKPACNSSGGLSVVGLKPSRPVNYTELRTGNGGRGDFNSSDGGFTVISTSGTKCETATNQATCKTGLDALNSRSGFYELCGQICVGYQLATSEGDLVTLIDTPQGFRDFLGPIDSAQEAAWRVATEGYNFECYDGAKYKTGVRALDGGFEAIALRGGTCGPNTSLNQYLLRVGADGTVTKVDEQLLEVGDPNCAVGRRPEGLIDSRRTHARSPLARHFEATASLEAAAVEAFIVMERELVAHGAPSSLSLRARIAAEDERRHTHTMASLARRFGGRPVRPVMERRPLRSLDAMALENVVEGCVRETFGALLAQRQGRLATDAEVRSTHQTIAAEETTHASLSWDLHGWMNQTLGSRSRRELVRASRRAVETLKHEFCTTPQGELADTAGLPSGDEAVAMIDGLDAALFRAALN